MGDKGIPTRNPYQGMESIGEQAEGTPLAKEE